MYCLGQLSLRPSAQATAGMLLALCCSLAEHAMLFQVGFAFWQSVAIFFTCSWSRGSSVAEVELAAAIYAAFVLQAREHYKSCSS